MSKLAERILNEAIPQSEILAAGRIQEYLAIIDASSDAEKAASFNYLLGFLKGASSNRDASGALAVECLRQAAKHASGRTDL